MKKKTSKRNAIKIAKSTLPKADSKLKIDKDDVKKTSIKLPTSKPSKPKSVMTKAKMPKHSVSSLTAAHKPKVSRGKGKPETKKPIKKEGQPKQTREQKKWKHAAELSEAKMNLQNAINQEIQKERSNGNVAQVTPQILTLLRTSSFNTKAVTKMKEMFNNRDKLREYLYIVDKDGTILSGDKAIYRYERFAKSGIVKPEHEVDVILQNFYEHLQTLLSLQSSEHYYDEDNSALRDFATLLSRLKNGDVSAVPERYCSFNSNISESTKSYMLKQNRHLVDSVGYYFQEWLNVVGESNAAEYISQHAEELNDALIKAAIAYYTVAMSAYSILRDVFSIGGANKIISIAMNDIAQNSDYYGLDFHDEG